MDRIWLETVGIPLACPAEASVLGYPNIPTSPARMPDSLKANPASEQRWWEIVFVAQNRSFRWTSQRDSQNFQRNAIQTCVDTNGTSLDEPAGFSMRSNVGDGDQRELSKNATYSFIETERFFAGE
jgi:hypothetical protein